MRHWKRYKEPYYTEEERQEYEYVEQMSHCDENDMTGVITTYDLIQCQCVKEYPLFQKKMDAKKRKIKNWKN